MNYKEISEKYPKAYNLLVKNRESVYGIEYQGDGWYHTRDLYDFFDENEIWISIELEVQYTREEDEDGNNPHYVPEGFYYTIHNNSYHLGTGGEFPTRTEAEEAAFTKALSLLEDKLTK